MKYKLAILNINNRLVKQPPPSYLPKNLIAKSGKVRALNTKSDMDNETTNGVVTWTLVRLKLRSATTVSALKAAPRSAKREAKTPANVLSVALNTNVSLTEQLCIFSKETILIAFRHVKEDVA